ncbi:type IV conjugative transfer system protein TraL [Deferribacter autotrophicus]|uniref:Type IV conjugative transfer system protein TraL n=1 Tax=Deferribacter autotrophicus TaxID=500465 RepID=A0A5A8F3G5_9BACT|nr:type IV conjugative transfer system protein TraL [Deferribacter autotrophicus]KAA0257524.1 type IV conjugative transfer system protein TraL [Deferribacter autotrophicus]
MNNEDYRIPKYLDSQPVILFWELDEFILFIVIIFVSMFIRHQFIGFVIAFTVVQTFKKIKKKKHKGFLFHVGYKLGLVQIKNIPPYHIKEFGD